MSRGPQPGSVRGRIRAMYPDMPVVHAKRFAYRLWQRGLETVDENIREVVSEGIAKAAPQKGHVTLADRIRQLLPTSYERAVQLLPDVPQAKVYHAVRAMIGYGSILKLDSGMLVAGHVARKKYLRIHRVSGDVCDEQTQTEPSVSTIWAELPDQSPPVTCPWKLTVPLSTCLDNYVATASGHRAGPAECKKCPLGLRRRNDVAAGVTC